MEELDAAIVEVLAADGRCSFTDLADKVGLSVSAVHQRVRRLEQRGVIRGYVTLLDHAQLGLPLAALVAVRPIDPATSDNLPDRLEQVPEVESCYSVAGEDHYVLLVRVAGPIELERLLFEVRAAVGVVTRTTVVLSTPFEGRPVSSRL